MSARRRSIVGGAALALAAVLAGLAALKPARPSGANVDSASAQAPGPPSVVVTEVQVGRNVGLDKRVTDPAEDFAPDETIYASVVTEGRAEHVRLTSRWTRAGKVVAEFSQGIEPAGTAVSEFNVWKPRGFSPGEYEVQILVDGVPAAGRRFTVR
jgi:hypothetical protein